MGLQKRGELAAESLAEKGNPALPAMEAAPRGRPDGVQKGSRNAGAARIGGGG